MRIADQRIIPLGYGKYVRSDRIVGMEPIEDKRGPGRRTKVYVQDLTDPIVASRSTESIMRDVVHAPDQVVRAKEQIQLLAEILETIDQMNPVLRSIIREQAKWDLDVLEDRIRRSLGTTNIA